MKKHIRFFSKLLFHTFKTVIPSFIRRCLFGEFCQKNGYPDDERYYGLFNVRAMLSLSRASGIRTASISTQPFPCLHYTHLPPLTSITHSWPIPLPDLYLPSLRLTRQYFFFRQVRTISIPSRFSGYSRSPFVNIHS